MNKNDALVSNLYRVRNNTILEPLKKQTTKYSFL